MSKEQLGKKIKDKMQTINDFWFRSSVWFYEIFILNFIII